MYVQSMLLYGWFIQLEDFSQEICNAKLEPLSYLTGKKSCLLPLHHPHSPPSPPCNTSMIIYYLGFSTPLIISMSRNRFLLFVCGFTFH